MNNHSNYNSSFRKELLTVSLACGFVPYKHMELLNPNRSSINHMALSYIEQGTFEKYHDKEIWAMSLSQQTRKNIFEVGQNFLYDKESLSNKFSESLKLYYKEISQQDYYRLKTEGKKYDTKRIRLLRNSEVFTFFYGMDFDTIPGEKKTVQELKKTKEKLINSTYFPFREFSGINKKLYFDEEDYEKSSKNTPSAKATEAINLTKLNGLVTLTGSSLTYAIYNTGKALDTYTQNGERKATIYINNILFSASLPPISGCIIFYQTEVPIKTILSSKNEDERKNIEYLTSAYNNSNIFGIPLSPEGQDLIRIMNIPDWQEILQKETIRKDWRDAADEKFSQFDAISYDKRKGKTYYHFNFLIPDLLRLWRFINFADSFLDSEAAFCVYCYKEFQVNLLKNILPSKIELRPIELIKVKERLGLVKTEVKPNEQ